jgi:two-component system, cell cycle sensor histidine kinase and response regulator CckA
MDMPYDPDSQAKAAELRAVIEKMPRDGMPRWTQGLSLLAAALAAVALACTGLLLVEAITGAVAQPVALVLMFIAVACGVAALVALRVQARFAGPLDMLSRALESSASAHLIVGPDGAMAYANATFRQLFPSLEGPALAALGRRIAPADGTDHDYARFVDEAARFGLASTHLALLAGEGRVQHFAVSAYRLAGRPGYALWSFEDVSVRPPNREDEPQFADFIDHAPIGFYSVDAEGCFLYLNAALADWLGADPQELIAGGARLGDFLARPAPFGAPPHAPFASEAGEERGSVVLRGRQGRILHAQISQSVERSGDDLRTRSVVRDLAPEREWQEALRLSRQRFQNFLADAPVGIALLDRAGRLEETNRALAQLLDTPAEGLIGKKLVEFLETRDAQAFAAKFAAVAKGEVADGPVEVRFLGPRGTSAAVFISRLAADEGGDGGVILHFIDTTEQKSLQAQFVQSHKMQAVGQLAGGVAHDFNNLLTAIIGFCDLLLLRHKPGDQSFPDIKQIEQNAKRAANLVRQLLAFSRQQSLQPRVLNITDVLAELSHLLRRLIGENIELKVVHARDLGLVKVDQGQFEQVVINLAVNARDAMAEGGTLTIRTVNVTLEAPMRDGQDVIPAGQYVEIQVADTGVGIPKANLERIFEPFFSTKEVGSGTGLGLSTVFGIVKQTGGMVRVASEPGKGAIFSIYLPRHQGEAGATVKPEAADAPQRDLTGAGTVLLVEDEDPVRLFSARALRNKGYKVIEAKSGEGALEIINGGGEKVDLLITDVVMPKMDGPALIKEVRELLPEMKVIFISGYAEDSFRKRLGDDSEIHFLPKPFSLKQLAGKVKEVMAVGA